MKLYSNLSELNELFLNTPRLGLFEELKQRFNPLILCDQFLLTAREFVNMYVRTDEHIDILELTNDFPWSDGAHAFHVRLSWVSGRELPCILLFKEIN